MTAQWKRSTLRETDSTGVPIVGARAFFFDAGTNTSRAVYSDASLTTPISQPVLTDSVAYWPKTYVQTGIYDYRIEDASGATILTVSSEDPGLDTSIGGALPVNKGGTGATTASGARSNLEAAAQADVDALNVDVGDIETAATALTARVTTAEADIAALETGIANLIDPSGTRRQCVQSAPVDSGGFSSFLPSTSGALSVNTQNITSDAPLIVSVAKGFANSGADERFGSTTANLSFTSLVPSSTNYLFVTVGTGGTLTAGSTTLAPIEQRGGTPSNAAGQFTFMIHEMKGYLGDGTGYTGSSIVFIGEAVTDGSGVTSTVAYSVRAEANLLETSNLPAANTVTSLKHNIGSTDIRYQVSLRCISAEHNYASGDETPEVMGNTSGAGDFPPTTLARRNTVTIRNGVTLGWRVQNATTGALATATVANWRIRLRAERVW